MFSQTISEEIKSKLESDFVTYLGSKYILQDIKKLSAQYTKSVHLSLKKGEFIPPFRYRVELDLLRIQQTSDNLFHLFIFEPDLGTDLAKYVIFCALNYFASVKNLKVSDVEIDMLVTSVPTVACLHSTKGLPINGLKLLQGILIAKSTVSKYIRSTVYNCPIKSCVYNGRQRFSYVCISCPQCCHVMEEDYRSRDLGDEVDCLLMMNGYNSQNFKRFQTVTIKIRDELCLSAFLELGKEHNFVCKRDGNHFMAWSIQERLPSCEALMKEPEPYPVAIPDSMAKLYLKVRRISSKSPWIFAAAVISQLGSGLFPESSFLNLKYGLSLSLASQKNGDNPVSISAVGADVCAAQKFFNIAGRLAERYITNVITSHPGGCLILSDQPDTVWQEAGPLTLATNGICNLGDWAKFKKQQTDYISRVIESGHIVYDNSTNLKNLMYSLPLRCGIWIYRSHITTKESDDLQLKTLINVFGMPFLAEERNEGEIKKICSRFLENAVAPVKSVHISESDLKEFFILINSRTLVFTESASDLIKNYFVASRKDRPGCLPLGALKTIRSLSEAHARISLRAEVIPEDVIAIIYLYEESISTFFGKSLSTSFRGSVREEVEPIYTFINRQRKEFTDWVRQYISGLI